MAATHSISARYPDSTAIHAQFSQRIYFLALRELRSVSDAEDVRNETLLRVIRAVQENKISSPDALAGFVSGTARNVIREMLRQRGRADQLPDGSDWHDGDPALPPDPAASKAILAVLDRLKRRERDFVRLYFYEELDKEEISQRLGIPPWRLRLIKSRTLESFRKLWGAKSQTGRGN